MDPDGGTGACKYTFQFVAADGMDESQPATVTITVDEAPVNSTIPLEHDAAGLVFDRWVTGYSTAYSGGGYVYGRWTGTILKATFTGSSVKWIGPKQPSYGMADVWVDGVKVATNVPTATHPMRRRPCLPPSGRAARFRTGSTRSSSGRWGARTPRLRPSTSCSTASK